MISSILPSSGANGASCGTSVFSGGTSSIFSRTSGTCGGTIKISLVVSVSILG